MKKFISTVALLLVFVTLCSCSTEKKNEHKHSYLPGSPYCESCGEEIVICPDCQMVSGVSDTECWFCHSKF